MGQRFSQGRPPRQTGEMPAVPGSSALLGDGESAMAPSLAREIALMRCAFELAQRNRRQNEECHNELLAACEDPAFADAALYDVKRGDQQGKTGLSVHFAREAVRCFPNIHYGFSILHEDEDAFHIEGWAMDLEHNRRIPYQDKFPKKIQRAVWENGKKVGTRWIVPDDEREVQQLLFRRSAFLMRNAILGLIPTVTINACHKRCDEVCAAEAKKDTETTDKLQRAIANIREWCDQNGVRVDAVETTFSKPLSAFDAADLQRFRSMANSVRDGAATIEATFGSQAVADDRRERKTDSKESNDRGEQPNDRPDKDTGEEFPLDSGPKPARDTKPRTLEELSRAQSGKR